MRYNLVVESSWHLLRYKGILVEEAVHTSFVKTAKKVLEIYQGEKAFVGFKTAGFSFFLPQDQEDVLSFFSIYFNKCLWEILIRLKVNEEISEELPIVTFSLDALTEWDVSTLSDTNQCTIKNLKIQELIPESAYHGIMIYYGMVEKGFLVKQLS